MMQHKNLLIKHSIERAEETLDAAKSNINISLTTAQNRNYYAVFYIVLALAYLDNFKTGKHHQMMGWFNKEYIYKNKIFNTELNEIYKQLMANREKSDYGVFATPEKSQVEADFKDAEFFVKTVKEYILNKIENK